MTGTHDDEDLARRMADGDEEALQEVVEQHYRKVKYSLLKRFGAGLQEHEYDEVLNAATFKLWHNAARFEGWRGSLGGWFLQIAVNTAIDLLRAGKRCRERYPQMGEEIDPRDRGDEPLPTDEAKLHQLERMNWFMTMC